MPALGMGFEEPETRQQPQVIVVLPPEPPPPPPEPAKPVIQSYKWPEPVPGAAQAFSLAMKYGAVRLAIAVWVQDGIVHYDASDGAKAHAALDLIDRELTRRLNAEKGLRLSL